MKERKTTVAYLTQKDTRVMDAVFMVLAVIGIVLTALWIFLFIGIGFLGFPVLFIGGGGLLFSHSSKISDEDFDREIKRIMLSNNIEENDATLKEYIIGKSEHIKQGKDKKIRTAYYCVTKFSFKKEICTVQKYVIDIFEEAVSCYDYTVPIGCSHEITEKAYSTGIGEVKMHFLNLNDDPEIVIPVNMKVYDTDAVIKRITHKR